MSSPKDKGSLIANTFVNADKPLPTMDNDSLYNRMALLLFTPATLQSFQKNGEYKKLSIFKCYLAMPIAVKADPHWFWFKAKTGVVLIQLGWADEILGPEMSLTADNISFELDMFLV